MRKYKVRTMSKEEFNAYVQRVRNSCPRGTKFFCDGTPNPVPKGKYKGIGKCKHYKHGECTFLLSKGEY